MESKITDKRLLADIPNLYHNVLKDILYQNLITNLQETQIHLIDCNQDPPNKSKYLIPLILDQSFDNINLYIKVGNVSNQQLNNSKPNIFYVLFYYYIYGFLNRNPDYHFYFWNVTFPNLFHCFTYDYAMEDAKNFIIKLYEITELENFSDLQKYPKIADGKYFPTKIRDSILKDAVVSFILHNATFRDSLLQIFFTSISSKPDQDLEEEEEKDGNKNEAPVNYLEALRFSFQSSLSRLSKQQIDAMIYLKGKISNEAFQELIIQDILIRSVKFWKYSPYFISNTILYDDKGNCSLLNDLNSLLKKEKTSSQKIQTLSDFFDRRFDEFLQKPVYLPPNYFSRFFCSASSFLETIFTKLDILILSKITYNRNHFNGKDQDLFLDTSYLSTKAWKYNYFDDIKSYKGDIDQNSNLIGNEVLYKLQYYPSLSLTLKSLKSTNNMIYCYYLHHIIQHENNINDKSIASQFSDSFLNVFNNALLKLLSSILLHDFKHCAFNEKKKLLASLLQSAAGERSLVPDNFNAYAPYFSKEASNFFDQFPKNNCKIELSPEQIKKINSIAEESKCFVKNIINSTEIQNTILDLTKSSNLTDSNKSTIITNIFDQVFNTINQEFSSEGPKLLSNTDLFSTKISSFLHFFNTYAHCYFYSYFKGELVNITFNQNEEEQLPIFEKSDLSMSSVSDIYDSPPFALLDCFVSPVCEKAQLYEDGKVTFTINIDAISILNELNLMIKHIQTIQNIKGYQVLILLSNTYDINNNKSPKNLYAMIFHQTLLFFKKFFESINIDFFDDFVKIINQSIAYFFETN